MSATALSSLGVGAAGCGAGGGLVEELRADGEGEGNVLGREAAHGGIVAGGVGLGGEALFEVVAPGIEVVDPGLNGEDPSAEAVDGEGG